MRRLRGLFISFVLLMWQQSALAQVSDRSSLLERALDQRALQSLTGREQAAERVTALPMEGAIDPDKYTVGPSDLFNVAVWGPVSFSYSLVVTPEGTLIIPTVGEISVKDRRLTQVKRQAEHIVRKRYPAGEITVTLLRPRTFVVSLRGVVTKQGQYIASAVDRVEKVLLEGASVLYPTSSYTIPAVSATDGFPIQADAYKPPRITQADQLYEQTSTRNIKLIRRSGDTLRVDIPKFYATRDDRLNPFLLDGDVIVVPRKLIKRNSVMVFGAVNAPGVYEYAEGDNLLDMIEIVGGTLPTADFSTAVITRVDSLGRSAEEQVCDLSAVRAGSKENPRLFPGDRIVVKEKRDFPRARGATVVGEVRQPGFYPITEGMKLTSIIQAAGGFTEHALFNGSFVLRKEEKLGDIVDPRLEILRGLRTHQLNQTDSSLFFLDVKIGRQPVVVDFKKLFQQQDTTQDIVLRDDDIVVVASDLQSVLVQGQVANPGYVAYVPGMSPEYYIAQAGGFSELAIEGDTRIIKKGSLEWKDPKTTMIESGDQVWIPKRPIKDFQFYFAFVRDAAQIASAIAATGYFIALIINYSK